MLLAAIAMAFAWSQAYAQSVSFGVKTEANASNYRTSGMGDMKSKLGLGASAGTFALIDFGNHFALQPELLVNFRNSDRKTAGVTSKTRYFDVEIPVYVVGQMKLANDSRMYIGVGPYASYGISARNRTAGTNLYKKNGDNAAHMKRLDAGLAGMIGYEFSNGLQVNASYKYGLLNVLDGGENGGKMKNQVISLGLGYRF